MSDTLSAAVIVAIAGYLIARHTAALSRSMHTRFASKSGPLEGNVVLTIEQRHARSAELGREILWRGALRLRIE
jgi:hypothetical protein